MGPKRRGARENFPLPSLDGPGDWMRMFANCQQQQQYKSV